MSSALQGALEYYWKILQQTLHVNIPATAAVAGAEFLGTVFIGKPIAEGILERLGGKNFRALSPQTQAGYKAIVVGLATVANTASAFAGGYAPVVVPVVTLVGIPGALGAWIGRSGSRRRAAQKQKSTAAKTTGITLDDLQRAAKMRAKPIKVEEKHDAEHKKQTGEKKKLETAKKPGTKEQPPKRKISIHFSISKLLPTPQRDKEAEPQGASARAEKPRTAETAEVLGAPVNERAEKPDREGKQGKMGERKPVTAQQNIEKQPRSKAKTAKRTPNIGSIIGALFGKWKHSRGEGKKKGEERKADRGPAVKIEEIDTTSEKQSVSIVREIGKRVSPTIRVEEVDLPEKMEKPREKQSREQEEKASGTKEPEINPEKVKKVAKIVLEETEEVKRFRELVRHLREEYLGEGKKEGKAEQQTGMEAPKKAVEARLEVEKTGAEEVGTAKSPEGPPVAVQPRKTPTGTEKGEEKKPGAKIGVTAQPQPQEAPRERGAPHEEGKSKQQKALEQLRPLITRIAEEVKRIIVEEKKKQLDRVTWREVRKIRKDADQEVQQLMPVISEVAAEFGDVRATKEQVRQLAQKVLQRARPRKASGSAEKEEGKGTEGKEEEGKGAKVAKKRKKPEDDDLMSLLGGDEGAEDVGEDEDIMSLLGGDEGGSDEDLEDLLGGL